MLWKQIIIFLYIFKIWKSPLLCISIWHRFKINIRSCKWNNQCDILLIFYNNWIIAEFCIAQNLNSTAKLHSLITVNNRFTFIVIWRLANFRCLAWQHQTVLISSNSMVKLAIKFNSKRRTAVTFDIYNHKLCRIWNKNSFAQIPGRYLCHTRFQIKSTAIIFWILFWIFNNNIAKWQICIAPNTVHIFVNNILGFSIIFIKYSLACRREIFISVLFIIILRVTWPQAILVNCNSFLFKIAEYERSHSSVAHR